MNIKRRDFLSLMSGSVVVLPLTVRAQQRPMPVIGYLHTEKRGLTGPLQPLDIAFRQGLLESGYLDGANIEIIYRYADSQYDRLPELAADLVHRRVDVIFASGTPAAVRAAKSTTATIPIVFAIGNDPVEVGVVASLGGPNANLTGVSVANTEFTTKRLELLHEIAPTATLIGWLHNPSLSQSDEALIRQVEAGAGTLGVRLLTANASTPSEIEPALGMLVSQKIGALLVDADPVLDAQSSELVALAGRRHLLAIYPFRRFVEAGGLISYGANLSDAISLSAAYIARILKGEKPADLPVQRFTRSELVVNRNTANSLGLKVPPSIMSRADSVID